MRFYSDYGRKKTIIILETNYYSNRPAKLFISKMKLYKSLHDFTLHFIRQIQFLRNKAFQKTIVKAVVAIEKKENWKQERGDNRSNLIVPKYGSRRRGRGSMNETGPVTIRGRRLRGIIFPSIEARGTRAWNRFLSDNILPPSEREEV